MQYIENKTFDEISVGDQTELTRVLCKEDIQLFAVMSGDMNPTHLDADYANPSDFQEVIANGMWGGALISALLGTELPGPGTVYVRQDLSFDHPVGLGDTVVVRVTVVEKRADRHVILDCLCLTDNGKVAVSGQAEVIAPAVKVRRPRHCCPRCICTPAVRGTGNLIEAAPAHPPVPTAVIHPCDAVSLLGALAARDAGLIVPVLVGPRPASKPWPRKRASALKGSRRWMPRTVTPPPRPAWRWPVKARSAP